MNERYRMHDTGHRRLSEEINDTGLLCFLLHVLFTSLAGNMTVSNTVQISGTCPWNVQLSHLPYELQTVLVSPTSTVSEPSSSSSLSAVSCLRFSSVNSAAFGYWPHQILRNVSPGHLRNNMKGGIPYFVLLFGKYPEVIKCFMPKFLVAAMWTCGIQHVTGFLSMGMQPATLYDL